MRKKVAAGLLFAMILAVLAKSFLQIGNWALLFWVLAAIPYFVYPREKSRMTKQAQENLLIYALAFLAVYFTIWWATGYIESFGRSPYSRTPAGLVNNFIFLGIPIATQEIVRTFLVGSGKPGKLPVPFLTGLLLMLYEFRFNTISSSFSSISTTVPYVFGTLAPAILQAVLLTWLAGNGGLTLVLMYRLLPEAVQWVLPTLPKTGWLLKMMVGVVVPLFTLLALQQVVVLRERKSKADARQKTQNSGKPIAWITLLVIITGMFGFTLGLYPIRPLVIATNSMLPAIRAGDVVILEPADAKPLDIGDVATYKLQGLNIVHRIISIRLVGNKPYYTFKGDNNDSADALEVAPDQILGKVIYVVPYIGLASLAIKTVEDPTKVPVATGRPQ